MPSKGLAVPFGYHTLTPYLVVQDAAQAMEFYKQVFGAAELSRLNAPDGKTVLHAELRIGDSVLMLSDESPQTGALSPVRYKGTAVSIFVYVPHVDEVFQRALKAGAHILMPVADMFWGDRLGKFRDPFGHEWGIASHQWDMTPSEIQRAAARQRA